MFKIVDKKEALFGLENGTLVLQQCSMELQNDKDVVLAAIQYQEIDSHEEEPILKFVSENLRRDKAIFLEAVKRNGFNLDYVHEEDQDEEVIYAAVNATGVPALSFVYNEEYLNNPEIVLSAMEVWPEAIHLIGHKLWSNKCFIREAIKYELEVYDFIDNDLLEDEQFMNDLKNIVAPLNNVPFHLTAGYIPGKINYKEIIFNYYNNNLNLISYDDFFNDQNIIFNVVSSEPYVLKFVSELIKDNKDIVLEAVKNDGLKLKYASERLKDDEEVVKIAILQDKYAISFASDRLGSSTDI